MRSWLDHDSPSDDGEVSLAAVAAELIELIAEHEPKWPRQWKNALADALHELHVGSLDEEALESWHRQQKAVLFLRLEIEAGRLPIFVRDPSTKEVLRLHPDNWIPFSPNAYIPIGGSDNFIDDGNYKVVGSDKTPFYGQLFCAFVDRQQVKAFINRRLIRSHNDSPQARLVRQAVEALHRGNPEPPGISAKVRNFEIQNWARANGHKEPPSTAVIKRVLREMKLERLRPEVNR
jgi:hypothetical protein